jgi:uncharacterized protein DUF6484
MSPAIQLEAVTVGQLVGITEGGDLLVDFAANAQDKPIVARTTIHLGADDVGRDIVLVFENGDPTKPIVMGGLVTPRTTVDVPSVLEFEAEDRVLLRCGEASITLTRAGKVIINGKYVSSSATGLNRIRGGAVHVN